MNPAPQGVDMNAIAQALHKHILSTGSQPAQSGGGNPTPPQVPTAQVASQGPPGGQQPIKSGPGFDSHTKVLSKALIHKLLSVV